MSEATPRPDPTELSREAERSHEELFRDIEQQGSMRLMTSARPEDIRGRAYAGFHEDVTDPGVFRSFTSETYAHLHNNLAETPDELDMDFDELMEQKGIHELVDFTPILQEQKEEVEIRKGLLRRKTTAQKGTGKMVPVLYSDLREDGGKEPAVRMTYYVYDADWTDYSGRKGQKLSLEIMLPASLAKELAEELRKDPQRVRDLVGTLLSRKMGATPEGAEAIRPRFESFDAERPANEAIRIQEMPVTEQEAKNESVVEEETPREEVEAQTAPTEKMHSLFEAFKSRADKFIREHFKGEYVEKPTETHKVEISKAVGVGLVGAVASIGGMKSFADVPRWFLQKYYTKQEQQRIKDAMDMASSDESADGKMDVGDEVLYVNSEGHIETGWKITDRSEDGIHATIQKGDRERNMGMGVNLNELLPASFPSPLEQKKQRLEKAITESKYLSPEKKQELLGKLKDTVETYDKRLDELEGERNEKIAKLLDEAIQTRVKGTTALKETLNTALIATGLISLRGAGYGVVAAYERWAKVKSEIAKGERKEGLAKEFVVNGFFETWDKLRLKEAKTKKEKYLNLAQAIGTVVRFAGFTGLAINELSGEGVVSGAIDKALDAFEKKAILEGAAGNFEAQFDKVVKVATLGMAGGEAGEAVGEAKEVEEAKEVGGVEEAEEEAPAEVEEAKEVGEEAPAEEKPIADAEAPAEAEASVEAAPIEAGPAHEYLSRDEVEVGTVRKGDGIIRMVQRQLKFNPEKYGYTGDIDDKKAVASWVRKTAFAAAKQSGFVNKDGWLGVSGKAIGNMGVHVTSENGALKLGFFDSQTGETSTLEEMRAKGFMYDYKKPDYELFEDTESDEKTPRDETPESTSSPEEVEPEPMADKDAMPTEEPEVGEPAPEDATPTEEAAPVPTSSDEATPGHTAASETDEPGSDREAGKESETAPEPEPATPSHEHPPGHAHEPEPAPEEETAIDSREPIKFGKETISFRYDAAGNILAPQSLLQYGASDETHLFDKIGTDRNTMDQLASAYANTEGGLNRDLRHANWMQKFDRLLKAQYTVEQMQQNNLQDRHPKVMAFLQTYVKNTMNNLEEAKTRYEIK